MAKPDPWLAFADPVDEAQPTQQGMGDPAAAAPVDAAPAAPANDAFASLADPAAPTDPAFVGTDQNVGGFADELPPEVMSRLKPEQIAQWHAVLKNPHATALQLKDTMHQFGFELMNAENIIDARNKGHGVNSGMSYQPPKVAESDGAVGAAARGFGDTVTMGALNKLSSGAEAVKDVLEGEGSFTDRYNVNLDYANAIEARDEDEHPYARISGQLIGGMVLPNGLEGVAAKAGATAMKEARAAGFTAREALVVGRSAAARAVSKRMAGEGAAYGAAYGAGSADNLEDAATGAVGGAAVGAAGGAILGTAAERVAPLIQARNVAARTKRITDGQAVVAAADRIGMDVLPADVGGPMTRRATGATAQTITGAGPIVSGAQKVIEQGKAVRDRVASDIGQAVNPEAAGEAAAIGARDYIKRSANRIGRIYDVAAAKAGDIRIPLTNAKATLDEQIARLREVPGGASGLKEAEDLRKAIDGDFTVQGVRDMRTEMFVASDFRGTPVERRLKQIVGAASDDIHGGLIAAGKTEAAQAFRAADDQWRERLKTIERVIEPIIGKSEAKQKSGEEIVKGLERAMQGNGRRFEEFVKALPHDEAGMVRASLIGRMGQSSKGRQDAAGEAFSLAEFLTHWNTVGERAKAVTFGAEGRAALNDLARVAQGAKEAGRYANHSNTGGALGNLLIGATALPTTGASLLLPYLSGKLLASPRFARWLARAPRTSLGQRAYVERLGRIARAEPSIAQDVLSLQSRLIDAFEPAKLAADDRTDTSQSR